MKQTRTEERKGATYNFCITGNHDDGYLRRTNTEEVKRWGLNQNEWLQSALQIRMAYSSVVRSMRSLGSVNISNKRKRNSSRRSAESILGAYCLHSYRSRPRWWVSSPNQKWKLGLNHNEWMQSTLQIRMAYYSSVVGWLNTTSKGGSFFFIISNKRKTDRSSRSAYSYRAGLQDDRRVRKLAAGSFRSEALAPGDESGRIDQQNSDVCDMNEWMKAILWVYQTRRSSYRRPACYIHTDTAYDGGERPPVLYRI